MTQVAELVLSVSDELATLADRDVDQSIERALGRTGEIAGADRCYLFLVADDGQSVSNTHEWCGPGVEPARDGLQDLSLDTFPWAFRVLDGTEELIVPDVSSAPPGPERAEWDREKIQSLFCTPLRVHGVPRGFLGCDWVRRPDPLGLETLQLVRVAAALVAGALERRRAYRSLETRSRFDELMLRLSARFIDLRGEDLGPAIDEALGAIARFVGVDIGTVMLFAPDGGADAAHGWRTTPGPAPDGTVLRLPPDVASWWRAQMRNDAPVVTTSVDAIDDAAVREALRSRGVGACVDLPLSSGGQLRGFACFATGRQPRSWTPDEIKYLQLAAQVISNTLVRAEADRAEARLQGQLRQTQKMDVVGQLAGGIAHDFNNLLLSITVCSDVATRALPEDNDQARQALGEIRDAADRAATLTRQLLTFSQRRVAQFRSVDLNALVDEMLRMIRRLVHESIEIEFRPGEGLGTLRADPSQIEQVLLNLCVNARDAMPTGGTLTLQTVAVPREAARHGPTPPPADTTRWVRLIVRDTGAGMDAAIRERAFEPFFTTKPPGKGSGLGLAIVYGIVRQHAGAIHLTSDLGRGTTFEIDLPVQDRAPEPIAVARRRDDGAGQETVLLAEDDESVRRTVTALLEHAGYSVLGARDGEQAVEIFRDRGHIVDLLVLDVIMPRKSGLDAWREIEALRPGIRTLFSSGYSMAVFPAGFFDDGRQQIIEKPYDASTLLRRIREMLDRPTDE